MSNEPTTIGTRFLESARAKFGSQKDLAERAMRQLDDAALHRSLDARVNNIAVIVKHMAGNMRSRWTHLLTKDGEKPWRNRDSEFVDDIASREDLMALWEKGWGMVHQTLDSLTPHDLSKTIYIRGNPLTVLDAIVRQLDHYGYHVGQIVLTARILAGEDWKTLSIAPGESEAFNERTWGTGK